jgi:Protein of unknown function (DUF3036).
MKQKELSRWLRAIVIVCWIGCVVLAGLVMPWIARDAARMNPELAYLLWPGLIIFWVAVVPVIIALAEAWNIFVEIGKDNSFCTENAKRLRFISYLAVGDTALTIIAAAVLVVLDALHPGVLLMMLAVVIFGIAAAVSCAALSHLTAKAAALKAENDLTI